MALRLEVVGEAAAEAREATTWYAVRNPAAAAAFERSLAAAFRLMVAAPGDYPAHLAGTRRILLDCFPYEVVYAVRADVILVLAVAHGRRRPGYWRGRAP